MSESEKRSMLRRTLISDSEDEDRHAEKNYIQQLYGTPGRGDRHMYVSRPGSRDREVGMYGEAPYQALALASPLRSRITMQAILQTKYLNSLESQSSKKSGKGDWMRVSHWRTDPNLSKNMKRSGEDRVMSSDPFKNAPRKVKSAVFV